MPESDRINRFSLRRDPMDEARTFLMLRGVLYNDLITGDHAAALFVEWAKAINARDEHILGMFEEWNATQISVPVRISTQKEGL